MFFPSSTSEIFSHKTFNRPVFRVGVTILLSAYFAWFFCRPLNLLAADLGRHIINGQIILEQPAEVWKVLHTNYYSYTNPTAPFINHHWLTGVIFFIVCKLSGFSGVEVFNILINLTTFLLFFRLAVKRAGFGVSALTSAFIIPLLAERTEVRPEIFTYLFIALFLTILRGVTARELRPRALAWLLPLQILWVNLHIYFFIGPILIGLWAAQNLITKNFKLAQPLVISALLTGALCLLNPSGLNGALYPARIFNNFAISVYENQSIGYFTRLGQTSPSFLIYFLTVSALIALVGRLLLKSKDHLSWLEAGLAILTALWAYAAIRNLTLFGYLALIVMAETIYQNIRLLTDKIFAARYFVILMICLLALSGFIARSRLVPNNHQLFGLARYSDNAANFIKINHLREPIVNNFDIGSYLIFYLYPQNPPFIDNRPEAYPARWINEVYAPLFMGEPAWAQTDARYNFNTIILSFKTRPPWAKEFILYRSEDPAWALVYDDTTTVILVRRTEDNEGFVKKYEKL